MCALMAVVGLFMIFAAEPLIKVLIIVIGAYSFMGGVLLMTTLLPLVDDKRYKIEVIARGAIGILMGLLCIILPIAVAKFAWQVMMYVIAIYCLISAGLEIAAIVHIKQAGLEIKNYVWEVVGTVIIAIILFMLPQQFGFTLIKIGGGLVLLAAVVLAIYTWKHKDIIVEDATVEDANDSENDKD